MKTMFRGKVRRIHFVGIGGIGMSGIAEVLLDMGYEVHGSDLRASDTSKRLAARGAVIKLGHREENVVDADVVVMSSAVKRDNPEVAKAHRDGVPYPRFGPIAQSARRARRSRWRGRRAR